MSEPTSDRCPTIPQALAEWLVAAHPKPELHPTHLHDPMQTTRYAMDYAVYEFVSWLHEEHRIQQEEFNRGIKPVVAEAEETEAG